MMTVNDQLEPFGPFKTVDSTGRQVIISGHKVHDEEAARIWVILMTQGRLAVIDRSDFASTAVSHTYRGFAEFAAASNGDNWPMVEAVRARLAAGQ
jgi:hypothetical protein